MFSETSFFFQMLSYVLNLKTKFHSKKSLLGAVLIFLIFIQCCSGVMLSFSFIPESMLVPSSRNEEDMGDLYTDDFFWVHERLVDLIFFLMYAHMYKKLSFVPYSKDSLNAWVSGASIWLLMHVSIFLGLCLCCTHLSDITLTIAANIIFTFSFKSGKVYWILFTDQTLNSDTVTRLAYLHYIVSLYVMVMSFFHAFEMHYDWKNHLSFDGILLSLSWLFFAIKTEISFVFEIFVGCAILSSFVYTINEVLSYEIFMWGDIGLMTESRFLGVSPHWYFRAYMGWLIVCPHHYIGVFGLAFFILVIYYQGYLKKIFVTQTKNVAFLTNIQFNPFFLVFFALCLACLFYTGSILPYGKFFNRVYGNFVMLLSYYAVLLLVTKNNTLICLDPVVTFYLKLSNKNK